MSKTAQWDLTGATDSFHKMRSATGALLMGGQDPSTGLYQNMSPAMRAAFLRNLMTPKAQLAGMPMKEAQFDMQQLLRTAGQTISDTSQRAADYYRGMDPAIRSAILRGLVGAGVGGTAMGLSHALNKRDPDERGGMGGSLLLGALLGGGAAAALPFGMQTLRGNFKFDNEDTTGPIERGFDSTLGAAGRNPGAAVGTAAGGIFGLRRWGNQMPMASTIGSQLQKLQTGSPAQQALLQRILRQHNLGTDFSRLSTLPLTERMRIMEKIHPGAVNFGTMLPGTTKVPLPQILQRFGTGNSMNLKYPTRATLSALRNVNDPRVKLLAAILGGAGLGLGVQKAVQGAV